MNRVERESWRIAVDRVLPAERPRELREWQPGSSP
jgi:hypothetical protein